jgi:O-glycosyl hydrolase
MQGSDSRRSIRAERFAPSEACAAARFDASNNATGPFLPAFSTHKIHRGEQLTMRLRLAGFAALAALAISGCGGGSTSTTPPPPPAAPTVTLVTPAIGATNVATNAPTIAATFNEGMSASSLTTSTFTLTPQGGSPVAGTVTYAPSTFTATFQPAAALAAGMQYTATLTTGAQSSSNVALSANYTWTFTTAAAAPPPPAPTVTAVSPMNGATTVGISTAVTATFSEAMDPSSVTVLTFTLTGGGSSVTGTVSYNATTNVATLTPSSALASSTVYTATITTGAESSAEIALAAPYTWTFTTAAAAPPPAPTVVNNIPGDNATNVSINQALTATFSQQMNSSTLNASTFTLSSSGGSVTGVIAYSSVTASATFTPSAALSYGTTYTATITTGAQNSSGTGLAANYNWSFTTLANPNTATVNFASQEQTIRGFGGSTAWLGAMPPAVATALFSPTSGLGLSILRVRIDPEGSAGGGGAHSMPYETGEWDYEATNGAEAVANNPNAIVFASPWTPPAAWKLNGSATVSADGATWNQSFNSCAEGTGYCGGYLDPTHYADYANFLEDFVHFFNTTSGVNLYAISMQNEPEENVTYESCVWTPEAMDTWVANNAATITTDAYSTKLMMPESNSFSPVDAAAALNDSNAEGKISIIGGHIYQVLFGGSIAPYSIPAGDTPKELWMSEFGPLSTAAPSWNTALTTYAESIHNSLVTGQYNAYVWWGIFGAPTAAGTWGLVDSSGTPTVMGEVVGQYSKYIQPGYVRVDVTGNPSANVFLSAYTGSGHYVIVAINASSAAVNQSFTLQNGTVTSLIPNQSTASAAFQAQSAVTVTGGQFTYTLPAMSITTFVQ